jgi:UDP-glucose 4-epimerase
VTRITGHRIRHSVAPVTLLSFARLAAALWWRIGQRGRCRRRQVHRPSIDAETTPMSTTILVTGGAGYIGSHVVRQLGERGERLVTLDDLSTGFADAVLFGPLIRGSTGNTELVTRVLEEHRVDTVMHFAARTIVPESVADPLRYYTNNTAATLNLLRCCKAAGVRRFIFSSTAAVYGNPATGICEEDSVTTPINPYGSSKLMSEWMLRDLAAAGDIDHVTLRYFNVAGSDPQQRIGQSTERATLLVKVASEAAVGKRSHVSVFGTDYPTPDGTGVRDYIHVEDLADAHLRALDHLRGGGESLTLNCGYGHGYSVREVLDAVARANGAPLDVRDEARRPGDPATLIARADRIREVLGWTPRYDDLDLICSTSLAWERRLATQRAAGGPGAA